MPGPTRKGLMLPLLLAAGLPSSTGSGPDECQSNQGELGAIVC